MRSIVGPFVGLDHPLVLGVEFAHERVAYAWLIGQQLGDHAGRAARVGHVHDGASVVRRSDAERGVDPAGRRATDEQRNVETLPLHLAGDVDHLVE